MVQVDVGDWQKTSEQNAKVTDSLELTIKWSEKCAHIKGMGRNHVAWLLTRDHKKESLNGAVVPQVQVAKKLVLVGWVYRIYVTVCFGVFYLSVLFMGAIVLHILYILFQHCVSSCRVVSIVLSFSPPIRSPLISVSTISILIICSPFFTLCPILSFAL
jgi:hypothetical protein